MPLRVTEKEAIDRGWIEPPPVSSVSPIPPESDTRFTTSEVVAIVAAVAMIFFGTALGYLLSH